MISYLTLVEAITDLNKRGFTIDFNKVFNRDKTNKFCYSLAPEKFEVTEVYRFEGESDPDDEAVIFAIESKDGYKGILVNGYGFSADPFYDAIVKKLVIRS